MRRSLLSRYYYEWASQSLIFGGTRPRPTWQGVRKCQSRQRRNPRRSQQQSIRPTALRRRRRGGKSYLLPSPILSSAGLVRVMRGKNRRLSFAVQKIRQMIAMTPNAITKTTALQKENMTFRKSDVFSLRIISFLS